MPGADSKQVTSTILRLTVTDLERSRRFYTSLLGFDRRSGVAGRRTTPAGGRGVQGPLRRRGHDPRETCSWACGQNGTVGETVSTRTGWAWDHLSFGRGQAADDPGGRRWRCSTRNGRTAR